MTIKIPIFILLCLPFVTGCFQEPRPDGLPKLYPMSIKITQEGTPLAEASVGLISSDPELQRWPAGANTDANGIAKIFTYGFPGCPEGSFKVTVSKMERVGNADDTGKNSTFGSTAIRVFRLIDRSFGAADTTSLSLEVTASSERNVTFDVGKSVREELKVDRSGRLINH